MTNLEQTQQIIDELCTSERTLTEEMREDLAILENRNEILWKLIHELSNKLWIYKDTSEKLPSLDVWIETLNIQWIRIHNSVQIGRISNHVSELDYIVNRL